MPSHLTFVFLVYRLHWKLIILIGNIASSGFKKIKCLRLKKKCFSVQVLSQLISWPENDNSAHRSLTHLGFIIGPVEWERQAEISSFIKICLQNEKAHIFNSLVSPWLKMSQKPCTWGVISVRCIFIKIFYFISYKWSFTKLQELPCSLSLP